MDLPDVSLSLLALMCHISYEQLKFGAPLVVTILNIVLELLPLSLLISELSMQVFNLSVVLLGLDGRILTINSLQLGCLLLRLLLNTLQFRFQLLAFSVHIVGTVCLIAYLFLEVVT